MQPHSVYLIDTESGNTRTFLECRDTVRKIAHAIGELGVKQGDKVGYAFANCADSALVILGLLYGGYVATAINLVAGESTIAYVLEHSEAKFVITDNEAEK